MSSKIPINVRRCARCGAYHTGLEFVALGQPIFEYTHWAPCPTTGEPILMRRENELNARQLIMRRCFEGEISSKICDVIDRFAKEGEVNVNSVEVQVFQRHSLKPDGTIGVDRREVNVSIGATPL